MLMSPLTYIHASEAARTTAGGRDVGGGKNTPPTACKWLRIDEFSARGGFLRACVLPIGQIIESKIK